MGDIELVEGTTLGILLLFDVDDRFIAVAVAFVNAELLATTIGVLLFIITALLTGCTLIALLLVVLASRSRRCNSVAVIILPGISGIG